MNATISTTSSRTLLACLIVLSAADRASAQSLPGPAPSLSAVACYNPGNGVLIISVNNIVSWYIESATFDAMTGAPAKFPAVAGSLNTDNDARVGQGSFSAPLTYVDHNLGAVVAPGTPLSNLRLRYSDQPTQQELAGPILLCVPEPATAALLAVATLAAVQRSRRR